MKLRNVIIEDLDDTPIYIKRRKPKQPRGKSAPRGSKLAAARIAAHSAFDNATWKTGRMTRSAAYRDMAKRLGIPKSQCHIINFDIETCERVIAIYEPYSFDDIS